MFIYFDSEYSDVVVTFDGYKLLINIGILNRISRRDTILSML